jgi:RNA recognition motif-containing protein
MVSSSVNAFRNVEQEHTNMRLYVGGLPYQTTEHDLIELFEQVGQVTSVSVITDRETGRSKGFGFVEMSDQQAARTAIERLNGTILGDRTITVNEARERQSGGSRGYQGRERRSNNGYRSNRY